jgi:polar amino acid transport system substrate-binding protein
VVVIVGAVRLDVPRSPFYEKELDLRMSRSYGPGRYDPLYEEAGIDYPVGYIRWTERRNMEAFVELLAEKNVRVAPLITHRYPIAQAEQAYAHVSGAAAPALAVLLDYPAPKEPPRTRYEISPAPAQVGTVRVGFIGAGHFAQSYLLPHLKRQEEVTLAGVCNATGPSARRVAERFGFGYCTTNSEEILNDPNVNAIFIATRHDLHARLVEAALTRGKNVFVEKPLAIRREDLARLAEIHRANPHALLVGFNRRFAPGVSRIKEFFAGVTPLTILYRVHAGPLPRNHWIYDSEQGGGRILSEVCHFVDLASCLAAARPISLYATSPGETGSPASRDTVQVNLKFANDSVATILYCASGDAATPKEHLEVFGGGRSAILHNFESLTLAQRGRRRKIRAAGKGHREEVAHFVSCLRAGRALALPFADALASMEATFAILDSLRRAQPVVPGSDDH